MKKLFLSVALVCAVVVGVLCLQGCASCSRAFKTFDSNVSGGLDRTVTLYDNTGNVVDSWEGKIDIQYQDGRTLFDLDGKRVTIAGGIVVVEEK